MVNLQPKVFASVQGFTTLNSLHHVSTLLFQAYFITLVKFRFKQGLSNTT